MIPQRTHCFVNFFLFVPLIKVSSIFYLIMFTKKAQNSINKLWAERTEEHPLLFKVETS